MKNRRDDLIEASMSYMQAQAGKHKMNIDILLDNGVGLAEHPDIMETIESELENHNSGAGAFAEGRLHIGGW